MPIHLLATTRNLVLPFGVAESKDTYMLNRHVAHTRDQATIFVEVNTNLEQLNIKICIRFNCTQDEINQRRQQYSVYTKLTTARSKRVSEVT